MSQGQNVTVDVLIGSKCHCGRSELGRFVQASNHSTAQVTYSTVNSRHRWKFISQILLKLVAHNSYLEACSSYLVSCSLYSVAHSA
jgi:hypothetical protein